MTWLRRLMGSNGKKRVKFDVEPDVHLAMRLEADRNGLSLNEWAVKTLTGALSPMVRATSPTLVEGVKPGPAPKRKIVPVLDHPCEFLSGERPPNVKAKDCIGTCRHRQQDGRQCAWPSAVADQCPLYKPRDVRQAQRPKL